MGGVFDEERKVVVLDLVIDVIYLKHGSLRLVDLIALGYSGYLMGRKCFIQGGVFVVLISILSTHRLFLIDNEVFFGAHTSQPRILWSHWRGR